MIKTVQLKSVFKHHDQIDCYLGKVSHQFKKYKYNIYVLHESASRIQKFWLKKRAKNLNNDLHVFAKLKLTAETKEDYQPQPGDSQIDCSAPSSQMSFQAPAAPLKKSKKVTLGERIANLSSPKQQPMGCQILPLHTRITR